MKGPAMRWLALLSCLLLATSVGAEDKPAPAVQALQLNVMGDITIDPTGGVLDYAIATPLAAPVKRIVDQSVRKWRFEPVVRGGRAVNATGKMFLLLTALPVGGGYRMKIDKVQLSSARGHMVAMGRLEYPRLAARKKVGAEVAVAVRFNAAGAVAEAVAMSSRLINPSGSEKVQAEMRALFEQASVAGMKSMRTGPADLEAGEPEELTIVMPFKYCTADDCVPDGQWRPAEGVDAVRPVPWLRADQQLADLNDLKQGQPIALDGALRLQTPVVGTVL